ncbi:MAG: NAD(P)H-hydrate epimerase [Mycobacteriaceae bacterium]|nr:NAD(P)H-hydrate epimerase [Mycobacteriaceae bacterium]
MSVLKVESAYRSDDIRAAEGPVLARLGGSALMDRAAARLAVVCVEVLRETGGVNGRRVVLLVGSGNNAGDALLAGARLRQRGAKVTAVLINKTTHQRGLTTLRSRGGCVIDATNTDAVESILNALADAELVVDGIVGISGKTGLRAPADQLVNAVPSGTPVVAVDLPSGVDPDTGETDGQHVVADVTVTFGAMKPCLMLPPAAYATGRVVYVDVGITGELRGEPAVERLTPAGVAARWPLPAHTAHKYSRGVLGVIAGSDKYPGAAVLAVGGAFETGLGALWYVGPRRASDQVLTAFPETMHGKGRVQAWLLGSGVESDPNQDRAVDEALESGLPCVVDAGALAACVRHRSSGKRAATTAEQVLLTPHAGELARMFNQIGHEVSREEVEARPAYHGRWLAGELEVTVLVKGPTTLVVPPTGPVGSVSEAPAWLATAGAGDVLAGIAGALMAAGVDAYNAGQMAAFVHGRAAALASNGGPIRSGRVIGAIAPVIAELLEA